MSVRESGQADYLRDDQVSELFMSHERVVLRVKRPQTVRPRHEAVGAAKKPTVATAATIVVDLDSVRGSREHKLQGAPLLAQGVEVPNAFHGESSLGPKRGQCLVVIGSGRPARNCVLYPVESSHSAVGSQN